MIVKGLNGKEYRLKLKRGIRKGSSYHEEARIILNELFPLTLIYEEVTLPGSGSPSLRADFYIPSEQLIIEVQGEQHYNYVKHFHKSKSQWILALKRDQNKVKWCELNKFRIIRLKHGEEWRSQIRREISSD